VLDLAIRNGQLVDGTGAPRQRADVGIVDGRIVAVGAVGEAGEELDAAGQIVAPGFVDVHTHFVAQVFWDPALTPSCLHGVTTAVSGNCGFTLAPWDADSSDYLVRMLSVVEGMPLAALQAGVPGDWRTTGEFLDRVEGTTAINLGFLVGHSAMRRLVMGPDAVTRRSTPEELAAMQRLLAEGLDAGGLGFSSSWGAVHVDANGDPVPSRSADADELVALAGVCARFDGTSLEFIPPNLQPFTEGELDFLATLSRTAGRPLNWNLLRITDASRAEAAHALSAGTYAQAHGGKVVALTMPIPSRARFSFKTGFVLDALPGWGPVMALPVPERIEALRDPDVRRRLREGARRAPGQLAENAQWDRRVIAQTFSDGATQWEGRIVGDIAAEQGRDPFDVLLDIVCSDGLDTTFSRPFRDPSRADWEAAVGAWRDGRALIGGSDAGAHLDFVANFDYPAYVLEHAVREHAVITLEEAVHLLTAVPARLYGLRDRGVLREGSHADIVVFDEATIATGRLETRFDLPTGAGRLHAEPTGISRVLVNGTTIVADGKLAPARPGRLLRSGTDTSTPALD
jgi:N-acyl-D-aspartate/D-glutamate deacylase